MDIRLVALSLFLLGWVLLGSTVRQRPVLPGLRTRAARGLYIPASDGPICTATDQEAGFGAERERIDGGSMPCHLLDTLS